MLAHARATVTANLPAGSMYFFLPWQTDRESGMDSKGCSLGRDKALVSTPWAWALLWIITSLSGVAAVCVCEHMCVFVCLCACLCAYVHACLLVTEWARGGNWNTERAININVILSHQGSPPYFFDDQLRSLLPPTVLSALLSAHYWPWTFKKIFYKHWNNRDNN